MQDSDAATPRGHDLKYSARNAKRVTEKQRDAQASGTLPRIGRQRRQCRQCRRTSYLRRASRGYIHRGGWKQSCVFFPDASNAKFRTRKCPDFGPDNCINSPPTPKKQNKKHRGQKKNWLSTLLIAVAIQAFFTRVYILTGFLCPLYLTSKSSSEKKMLRPFFLLKM